LPFHLFTGLPTSRSPHIQCDHNNSWPTPTIVSIHSVIYNFPSII
jgi:hypothetical protein